jgi:hypothetical protein
MSPATLHREASKYLFGTINEEEGNELLQKVKIARKNNGKIEGL